MVSGLSAHVVASPKYSLSDDAINALRAGDTSALIQSHRSTFGGFVMEKKDDDKGKQGKGSGSSDDSGDGDEDDDESDDDDSDDDDASGDDDSDDDSDDSKEDKVSKKEFDKLQKRMKAADRRAAQLEKERKEAERKEKSDLENAQSDLKEKDKTIESLQSELSDLKLNNAFLAANKITWHNPAVAMKVAQSEGYLEDVVDDDGDVDAKALGVALKKLAKDNQYLVKRGKDDDDDEGEGSSGEPGRKRSRNNKDDDGVTKRDAQRAPSLGRRRPMSTGSRR